MLVEKEFKVNEYITLKLEDGVTNIYIAGSRFNQCKYLMLNIPVNEIDTLNELDSIDEVAESLDHSLEGLGAYEYDIPSETEFWAHCSNLQAWYENGYDTRLIHRNLAFSLLKRLTDVGDRNARMAFKDEIAIRYKSNFLPVKLFLIENSYLYYLTREELQAIAEIEELEKIREDYFIDDLSTELVFASIYIQMNTERKALEIVNFIEKKDSKEPMIWQSISNIYHHIYVLKKGNPPLASKYLNYAITTMNHAMELNSMDYYAITRLARYYMLKKDFIKAKKYLEESLDLNSNFVDTWSYLGHLNYYLKDYKK